MKAFDILDVPESKTIKVLLLPSKVAKKIAGPYGTAQDYAPSTMPRASQAFGAVGYRHDGQLADAHRGAVVERNSRTIAVNLFTWIAAHRPSARRGPRP